MNPVERSVQHALYHKGRSSYQLMVPNYTPHDWWECDLFCVTKAGYFHEHEIKNTVADFKADARKRGKDHRKYDLDHQKYVVVEEGKTKHARLAEHDPAGPSRFFYVLPEYLADRVEIPEWAGLKTFQTYPNPSVSRPLYMIKTQKKAPRLHQETVSEGTKKHARGVCYYRYWDERLKHAS